MNKTVEIRGNTFPVKEQLKALEGKWNAAKKCWEVPRYRADEARKLVAAAPKDSNGSRPKVTNCVNCGERLDNYQIQRGYRRCLDCVEGGSRYMGGASYRDSNGNFVLGADD